MTSRNLETLSDEELDLCLQAPEALYNKFLAEESLKEFIEQAWQVVEPKRPFIDNWHIDCIVDHLEAATKGDIKKLIINIPPRHSKSLIVCVFWPMWVWTTIPHFKWLFSSYNKDFSLRDSRKCRMLIQSPWYQSFWGNRFCLSGDQNVKSRFENNKMGYRLAVGFGGQGTGEGGDGLVVDDPHNTEKVWSKVSREATIRWHDNVWFNRLNDEEKGVKVYVGQRSHDKDLFAHLIKEEGDFEQIVLPAEYTGKNQINTSLDWKDKRRKEGELLNPIRFSEEVIEGYKKKGVYVYSAQYQQNPTPLEGGAIELRWFQRYRGLPPATQRMKIVQSWDTAQEKGESNAYWVCGTWWICYAGYYLVDVFRKRMNYPEGKKAVVNLALNHMPDLIIIEQKSTGASLLQELPLVDIGNGMVKLFNFPLLGMMPDSDKLTRMVVESDQIQCGRVYLPEFASWLITFEEEIGPFPNSEDMDQVDMLSQFLRYMKMGGSYLYVKPEAFGDSVVRKEYKSILEDCDISGNRRGFDGGIV